MQLENDRFFCCCSSCPAQAWLDWWQQIGFLQRAHKLENGEWRFKRTLVFQFTTIKKTTVTWKEKSWKKVCEMSKYLTLIPLLREMYFPALIPDWWRKKQLRETEISMAFFLGKCDLEHLKQSFPRFFFLFHLSSSSCFYSKLDSWRKTFLYILSIIGFISVFMAGDKMAGHFNWPLPTSPTPTGFVFFFSFSISDILLPVSSCSF